jgi:hypothetical protein
MTFAFEGHGSKVGKGRIGVDANVYHRQGAYPSWLTTDSAFTVRCRSYAYTINLYCVFDRPFILFIFYFASQI